MLMKLTPVFLFSSILQPKQFHIFVFRFCLHPLLHDLLHPANFRENTISFPKPVLIRGVWWSSNTVLYLKILFNTENNISNSNQLWTLSYSSTSLQNKMRMNVTITYLTQPIWTKSISLRYNGNDVNFISDLSKIQGYSGNYWAEGSDLSSPFEIEFYGCEDFNLEKGKCHLIFLFLRITELP